VAVQKVLELAKDVRGPYVAASEHASNFSCCGPTVGAKAVRHTCPRLPRPVMSQLAAPFLLPSTLLRLVTTSSRESFEALSRLLVGDDRGVDHEPASRSTCVQSTHQAAGSMATSEPDS
jgi:hypothetical protein